MTEKKIVDWELVEKLFRAGELSLRQICTQVDNAITEGAIRQRAKKSGWTRDLQAKIAAKAKEIVQREEVRKERLRSGNTQLDATEEREIVSVGASRVANVEIKTNADVETAFDGLRALAEELAALSNPDFVANLEKIGELLDESGPDENGRWKNDKVNELYRYVISLSGRVKNAKDLAAAYASLAPMLRKFHGLDGEKSKASEIDELLKKVHAERMGAKA